jgi:hypothetical protein
VTLCYELDSLHKTDQLLERHNLPKVIQKVIESISKPIFIQEIERKTKTKSSRSGFSH